MSRGWATKLRIQVRRLLTLKKNKPEAEIVEQLTTSTKLRAGVEHPTKHVRDNKRQPRINIKSPTVPSEQELAVVAREQDLQQLLINQAQHELQTAEPKLAKQKVDNLVLTKNNEIPKRPLAISKLVAKTAKKPALITEKNIEILNNIKHKSLSVSPTKVAEIGASYQSELINVLPLEVQQKHSVKTKAVKEFHSTSPIIKEQAYYQISPESRPKPKLASEVLSIPSLISEEEVDEWFADSQLYQAAEAGAEPVSLEAEYQDPTTEINLEPSETGDDSWIEMIMLNYQAEQAEIDSETDLKAASEANNEAPATADIILSEIVESIEMPEQLLEQTENLVDALPEIIVEKLALYIQEAEPEAVMEVKELVIKIAPLADRLHKLSLVNELDSEEYIQIQQELVTHFEELLIQLEIEADEQLITHFIEIICSQPYGAKKPKTIEGLIDESLLEKTATHKKRKLDLISAAKHAVHAAHHIEQEIACLMVYVSTNLQKESLN